MKKLVLVLMMFSMIVFSACATTMTGGPFLTGAIYSGYKTPAVRTATKMDANRFPKKGKATCVSVLGIVAVGNCSVDAAMENGHITKVHHVEYKVNNVLGIYSSLTTIVYGE